MTMTTEAEMAARIEAMRKDGRLALLMEHLPTVIPQVMAGKELPKPDSVVS